jgi:hypothetical protein
MKDYSQALAGKGWGRAEIKRASDVLAHAEMAKSPSMQVLEQAAFWVALLTAIIGNFILSVVLVPFLLLLSGIGLYLAIFVIGVAFGTLFNVLIGYIENLGEGQHIIAGAFIPALALINIYIITHFSNKLEILLQLTTPPHSPLAVSVTYVIAFVLPYLTQHFQHVRNKQL